MLPAQRRDPNVVRRNRLTSSLQFQPDSRVMPRSLNANIEDGASVQHSLQRPFVRIAVARLRDTKRELAGYNDRDRKLTRLGHGLDCSRRFVKGKDGQLPAQMARRSRSMCRSSGCPEVFRLRSVS